MTASVPPDHGTWLSLSTTNGAFGDEGEPPGALTELSGTPPADVDRACPWHPVRSAPAGPVAATDCSPAAASGATMSSAATTVAISAPTPIDRRGAARPTA